MMEALDQHGLDRWGVPTSAASALRYGLISAVHKGHYVSPIKGSLLLMPKEPVIRASYSDLVAECSAMIERTLRVCWKYMPPG